MFNVNLVFTKSFHSQTNNANHMLKKSISHIAVASVLIAMAHSAQAQYSNPSKPNQAQVTQTTQSTPAISGIDRLIYEATQQQLATHPTWLRLHYYDTKETGDNKTYTSKVEQADFFISPNGQFDPQAELEATIAALVAANLSTKESSNSWQNEHANQSIVCNFPARTYWLKSQLNIADSLIQVDCPEFDTWMQDLDAQRLSVVFAQEYLDNPMSAFGHTLMLIDSSASLADSTAINKAHALNDTVAGNPEDNFIVYSAKSITGVYANQITIEPYPKKLRDYLQQDQRDVWTYPLALSGAQVQQIMRHVWETKDLGLPYYFTMNNCASEILRYIDVVRPQGNLLEQFKYAIVPSDVIRMLQTEGLLTGQTYIPADDTLAQAKANNSNNINRFSNNSNANNSTSSNNSNNSNNSNSNSNNTASLPKSSLTKDNTLVATTLIPVNNNPLVAHDLQRVTLGAGTLGNTGYANLGFRVGFNDLLDRPDGYPQNFELQGLSASIRVYEHVDNADSGQVELQDFTIISGRSFNPINTADNKKSWGVNLQLTQVKDGSRLSTNSIDSNHLVGSFAYEQGIAYAFGTPKQNSGQLPPQLCYGMGAGMLQGGKGLTNGFRVGVGINVGCRYQIRNNARVIGELQLPYWYHGDVDSSQIRSDYWQPILSLGAQYDINKNQAIRLQGAYEFSENVEGGDNVQLAYVNYF